MLVYKYEDVDNRELATLEEVKRAFFGVGILVKDANGKYYKVVGLDPNTGRIYTHLDTYDTQNMSPTV